MWQKRSVIIFLLIRQDNVTGELTNLFADTGLKWYEMAKFVLGLMLGSCLIILVSAVSDEFSAYNSQVKFWSYWQFLSFKK